MSINLFVKELRSHLKGTMITTFAVVFYIVFSVSIYSIIEDNLAKIVDIYSSIPKGLRTAFHYNMNDWDNVLAFYATYFVFYIPVIAGCYSIILGTKLLSKEEQYKTAEFLLSRPISREQIVTSKLLTFMIHVLGMNLIAFLVALLSCGVVTNWDFSIINLTILHTYGLLMCFFFGVLGFFITATMKRAKAITGIGIGIVLGTYYFDMLIRVSNRAQFTLYFTPFKYLNLDVLAENYGLEIWRLAFFLGITSLLIFLTYMFYRKKDILI